MHELGLDRYEWESEWEMLQPLLADSPAETLPEVDRLVERILRERGFAVDDPAADDGAERELLTQFRSAHETARAVDLGEDVDPGDIAAAINELRDVYASVLEERRAP